MSLKKEKSSLWTMGTLCFLNSLLKSSNCLRYRAIQGSDPPKAKQTLSCWPWKSMVFGARRPLREPFVLHLQNHVWEDVTLHNSSLPPLAIKEPECLGLLHQLDRSMDAWVQHYCILKDGCLYFYASIRSTQASGKKLLLEIAVVSTISLLSFYWSLCSVCYLN